jgi:hypothetical protein
MPQPITTAMVLAAGLGTRAIGMAWQIPQLPRAGSSTISLPRGGLPG